MLNDVALEVMPGEVHGLLGQNGSGKSTLIKILAGFHEPEPGAELIMYGENVGLPIPPGAARRLGLAFVHQHLGLVPSLMVLENLLIGDFANSQRPRINWPREAARVLVAIVRALADIRTQSGADRGVLVLDEPTPFLPKVGVEQLFALVRDVVKEGAAVILVSHDIDEVREITDRATVPRDGNFAGTVVSKGATADQLVELIIGRHVSRYKTEAKALAGVRVAVSAVNVSREIVRDVSYQNPETVTLCAFRDAGAV